jgi:Fe-S-cluster containining protein
LTGDQSILAGAVRAASQRAEVRTAVRQLYTEIETEIAVARPICVISGRCCRFDDYGHRLYVTTMELAAFVHDCRAPRPPDDGKGCPYQVNKLCSVRADRPMGCRLFFCDAAKTDWMQQQFAAFHSRLKQLHDALQVPYAYLEWRSALTLIGEMEG